jgi:hypothetical protein
VPFQSHPVFTPPTDPDVTLWRYVDFTKYVASLESSSLFFANAGKLNDPYEGSLPIRDQADDESKREYRRKVRDYIFVNCWQMAPHESEAMWRLYLTGSEGLAIRSTFRKVTESIADPTHVYFGTVKYLEYDQDQIDHSLNMMGPYVCKRNAFEHEREVRGLIPQFEQFNQKLPPASGGILINVNLSTLVDSIVVSPTSASWFKKLVSDVTTRFGYNFPIVDSSLIKPPGY